MKIKKDFVTNSSSTSFVIISNDDFIEDDFYKLVGISKESDLIKLFKDFYYAFQNNMEPLTEDSIETRSFSKETQDKIKKSFSEKKNVYVGKLSSDDGWAAGFLCVGHILLEDECLFIDATINAW